MSKSAVVVSLVLAASWAACSVAKAPVTTYPVDDAGLGSDGSEPRFKLPSSVQSVWGFDGGPLPSASIPAWWGPSYSLARPQQHATALGAERFDGLSFPPGAVDSIALRGWGRTLDSAGLRCARARDPDACELTFQRIAAPPTPLSDATDSAPWHDLRDRPRARIYLVVERAGSFTTVSTTSQALALLGGSVDSVPEAALIARLHGYGFWGGSRFGWPYATGYRLEVSTLDEVPPALSNERIRPAFSHLVLVSSDARIVVEYTERAGGIPL